MNDAGAPLDIRSGEPGAAGLLGNFTPHAFTLDGAHLGSMEGFLQGLKIADPTEQARVNALSGLAAKESGQAHDWRATGQLWWRGAALDRFGAEYQALLDRAYEALATQNAAFREALLSTGNRPLIHTIGKSDPRETVLTIDEMCERLMRLRKAL